MKPAKFFIGQCIQHRLFDYRGVIVDVDPRFQGTEAWYQTMARTRPPRNEPWYHVLVHDQAHETYVAERNLVPDASNEPVNHPLVARYFSEFRNGRYLPGRSAN
jgi:heat shock protein HspQ